ncbi:transporter [Rhodoblastus acidophilus]|uniref:Transporter n=1 Tax=Candidatus Rhodoblastus alkanivorans TaxID=2954117 RepID=A0ABS9Z7V9_9HYPH|nr:transporter [Candidatus Rhodoblastus alkanivorans]MCI4677892.1 transporter [Candidatus Rhodoblastus alkanivorans]MCI4683788.1 transporter [Candidatus Rhodoblastus alkanivorans]MDI4641106.1 transporter [Rhodoblastus acidophilus]
MNFKAKLIGAAMGALGLCGVSTAALAGSTNPPGERAGLDLATPLPEGVYFVNITGVGNWRDAVTGADSNFSYNVPIVAWSTPWNILGGHVQLLVAAPELMAGENYADPLAPGFRNSFFAQAIYNPFVAGQLAWNFGNGFSVSYLAGAYIGISDAGNFNNAFDRTTFHQQLALAYHGGGWNATANLMLGILGNQGSCYAFGPVPSCQNNDYFNYDLALTHTFGKWEFGMVAFGSTDFGGYGAGWNASGIYHAAYAEQSQFALGGLMGYNFGPVITQFIVSTDVATSNYNNKQTQFLAHVIIPIWNPETPKVVTAKY